MDQLLLELVRSSPLAVAMLGMAWLFLRSQDARETAFLKAVEQQSKVTDMAVEAIKDNSAALAALQTSIDNLDRRIGDLTKEERR